MKIQLLETHDRKEHLIKDQSANVFQGAEDCLKNNPLSLAIQEKSEYIYLYAHPRTAEDGVNKALYWQPRLSIPEASDNSYLFRAISKTDMIEIVWIIPDKAMWKQYQKGKVTEDNLSLWSINQFLHNKEELEKPHPDDMPEDRQKMILQAIIDEKLADVRNKKMMENIYVK